MADFPNYLQLPLEPALKLRPTLAQGFKYTVLPYMGPKDDERIPPPEPRTVRGTVRGTVQKRIRESEE